MMIKSASLFSQLLREVPRGEFARIVARHGGQRAAKGFDCWTQLVAMLFCHLARADSLREICNGLACCLGKLVHLGVGRAPNKSTLSYANAHRPADIYRDLFWAMLGNFRERRMLGEPTRFRFKNKLLSLDASTISLCLSLFPWARFRRAKGGIKLHVLLDHADYLPGWMLVTEARRHESTLAKTLRLARGSIVAMDRGYNDFALFQQWCDAGVWFVTRLKEGTIYEVVRENALPRRGNILADEVIGLVGPGALDKCPALLRRVVVWDPVGEREIELLTNHLEFGATTIAAIYKERWQIEIFFKTLKQQLRVKTFVGTSENALLIQIWTALIALLVLRWLHHRSRAGWSLSGLAAMLRLNLFTYRDLSEWLHNPLSAPPWSPDTDGMQQLTLAFPGFGQQTA
jgi:hypothetical protein